MAVDPTDPMIDLTDPAQLRAIADRIAFHATEQDAGAHFHVNGFLKPNVDGSYIIDLKSMGVDIEDLGLTKATDIKYEHFIELPEATRREITQAISDHVVDVLNDPETKFKFGNADGSKMYFLNPNTGTNLVFDPNSPHGGTLIRSTKPAKAKKAFGQIDNTADEAAKALAPEGKPGGLAGAMEHYEDLTGNKPHVTGPIEGFKPKAPVSDIDAPKGLLGKLGDLGKRSGPIGGLIIGGVTAGITLVTTGSTAQAAETAFEVAVPYGETMLDLAEGDTEAAAKSAAIETGSNIGGWGGLGVGAIIGQILIPIPGVGAAVGGLLGSLTGGFLGGEVAEQVYDLQDDPEVEAALKESAPEPTSEPEDLSAAMGNDLAPDLGPELEYPEVNIPDYMHEFPVEPIGTEVFYNGSPLDELDERVSSLEALRNNVGQEVIDAHEDLRSSFEENSLEELVEMGKISDEFEVVSIENENYILTRGPNITSIFDKERNLHVAVYDSSEVAKLDISDDMLLKSQEHRTAYAPGEAPEISSNNLLGLNGSLPLEPVNLGVPSAVQSTHDVVADGDIGAKGELSQTFTAAHDNEVKQAPEQAPSFEQNTVPSVEQNTAPSIAQPLGSP